MKQENCNLVKSILIPLAVGGLSAILSGGGMQAYSALSKPPLAPPGWLFPVVWTILYILMGIASYLVCTADAEPKKISEALAMYGYQLLVNFLWSIFFFTFGWCLFAFFWLVLLWILILVMIVRFWGISKTAAYRCIPYLLWVTFAGYLNLGICLGI